MRFVGNGKDRSPLSKAARSDLRVFPTFAVFAGEKLVGLRIANAHLVLAIPGDAAAELQAQHPEQAHVRGTLDFGDVADGRAAGLDGLEKVGPKLLDVLVVGLASGHPSAELKHGVIALISPEVPSVFIAPDDSVLDKNISNIEEVKARKGPVIAIGTEGNTKLAKICDDVIYIPTCPDYLSPILTAIPLQLLAYHTAVHLGCDVDKPRNLAKSVTVE